MKVWELIAQLGTYPANYDVTIIGDELDARRTVSTEKHDDIGVVNIRMGGDDE